MPISIQTPIRRLSQAEFADLAYHVMGVVFDIHKEYGRLFDERVYKRELAKRLPGTCLEAPVEVCWLSFTKRYQLDVLVEQGGLFEFKATDGLLPRDRAQTLNYLLLVDSPTS